MNEYLKIFLFSSIPSAVMALGIWLIQRMITRQTQKQLDIASKLEKKREELEACREEHMMILVDTVNASLSLGEATAIAIRDKQANGEVKDALAESKRVRHQQEEFYRKHGIQKMV